MRKKQVKQASAGKFRRVWDSWLADSLQIVFGSVIAAWGLSAFLIPARIAAGGVSGVATILFHLFGWPVGLVSIIINIPLFAVGWRHVGRRFAVSSLVAMLLMSLFIDIIHVPIVTTDRVLATLYGGVVLGAGLGLVMRAGATTGGTDMLAKLVQKKLPNVSVAWIMFAVDVVIAVANGVIFELELTLYALVALFLSSKVIDLLIEPPVAARAFWVMSSHNEQIARRIHEEIARGSTFIRAEGSYSGQQQPMLLCIVGRAEVAHLKRLIHQQDKHAFVMVTDAREVLGEGFKPYEP
nr:YitT family protein [Maliibacterium massiliense]